MILKPKYLSQIWFSPALQSRNDLGEVVADEAEPDVVGELLDDATQRVLCVVSHRVGLVQNDLAENILGSILKNINKSEEI